MRTLFGRMLSVIVLGITLGVAACSQPTQLRPQSMVSCSHDALYKNGHSTGPAIVAAAYGSVSDVPLNAVTVMDRGMFDSIMTQSLYSERKTSGAVHVTARFVNCTDARLALRVRTNFLRANQAPAEPVSAWQDVFIEPHGLAGYEESSLATNQVVAFLVELDAAR